MDFDLEDVVKVGLVVLISVLLLKADLSVVVKLTCEQEMVCWLYLQVVALAERVDHPIKAFLIFDNSTGFLSDCKQIDSIFTKDQKVVCL